MIIKGCCFALLIHSIRHCRNMVNRSPLNHSAIACESLALPASLTLVCFAALPNTRRFLAVSDSFEVI